MPSDGAFQLEGKGVRLADITDGLSNTILAGEKHVPMNRFGDGFLDSSTYNGDFVVCFTRGAGMKSALATRLDDPGWKFGSYHTGVCQFVLCDGSVQAIPHTISPEVLFLLCCRNDGQPTPEY